MPNSDHRVEAGLEWSDAAAPVKQKELETPGFLDVFLKRVDEQIAKKQLSM